MVKCIIIANIQRIRNEDIMVTSLAFIFIFGLLFGNMFKQFNLPALIGMILAGILIGPYFLEWLSEDMISLAPELRQIALVIILTRAGLSLNLKDIRKVGRPAALLSFLPALFEIIGITFLAPIIFDINTYEAMLLACVLAAVSPAIIVPKMLELKKMGFGKKRRIPDMITLAASLDDIFVIVLFTTALSLVSKEEVNYQAFFSVPSSIILGIGVGVVLGIGFLIFDDLFDLSHVNKIIVMMAAFFLCLKVETFFTGIMGFSSLLAIMCVGITINFYAPKIAKDLAKSFESLWGAASIWLFVLVGASLNIAIISNYALLAIVLVFIGILCRWLGVTASLMKTPFHPNEKLFITYSYIPKATVQAAIGGIPLGLGLPCGELVLTVSILAILITAPLGATLMDRNAETLLRKG